MASSQAFMPKMFYQRVRVKSDHVKNYQKLGNYQNHQNLNKI